MNLRRSEAENLVLRDLGHTEVMGICCRRIVSTVILNTANTADFTTFLSMALLKTRALGPK